MNRDEWIKISERCETAESADYLIDIDIYSAAFVTYHLPGVSATGSFDAITEIIKRELPGWMVRVQWCNVSAEAWVAPDLNSPDCPPDIAADPARWHDYAERNEVEIRPGSRAAAIRALCAAFCRAMAERDKP